MQKRSLGFRVRHWDRAWEGRCSPYQEMGLGHYPGIFLKSNVEIIMWMRFWWAKDNSLRSSCISWNILYGAQEPREERGSNPKLTRGFAAASSCVVRVDLRWWTMNCACMEHPLRYVFTVGDVHSANIQGHTATASQSSLKHCWTAKPLVFASQAIVILAKQRIDFGRARLCVCQCVSVFVVPRKNLQTTE